MKKVTSLLVLTLVLIASNVTAQSYQVIVNEGNGTTAISKGDLSKIFLKQKSKWDDGSSIVPLDQNASSSTRATFSDEVHGRGVGAIRSFWQQAAFSGAGTAPLERGSDADVIAFVKSNPGAVGYISADTEASGVKVVSIQ